MSENAGKKSRVRYYVEKNSFCVRAAAVCMLLSAVLRLIGSFGLWGDSFYAVSQIALPVFANLLFILCLLWAGKRLLALSCLPVILGAAFFIIRAAGFESWLHMLLCIILYLAAALIYTATVLGYIHVSWPLLPLFGLPFLYHIFIEDIARLRDSARPVSFNEGLQELSVLCIMLALFFTALAMKKQKKPIEEQELPKIKAPKVIKPDKSAPAAQPEGEAKPAAPEIKPLSPVKKPAAPEIKPLSTVKKPASAEAKPAVPEIKPAAPEKAGEAGAQNKPEASEGGKKSRPGVFFRKPAGLEGPEEKAESNSGDK